MTEFAPLIGPYTPALTALAILALAVPIQAFLTAPLAFVNGEQAPGMPLQGDHTLLSFRAVRTHANSVESLPAFGFAVLLAVLLGASETITNWAAGIHVAFRLLFWVVYYAGIGAVAGGPRTLSFVGSLVSNLVLSGAVLWACLF